MVKEEVDMESEEPVPAPEGGGMTQEDDASTGLGKVRSFPQVNKTNRINKEIALILKNT